MSNQFAGSLIGRKGVSEASASVEPGPGAGSSGLGGEERMPGS